MGGPRLPGRVPLPAEPPPPRSHSLEIQRPTPYRPAARIETATDRKNLTVKMTTEGDHYRWGRTPPDTALPVSTAFAAAGGLAGYDSIRLTPEAGRGLTPIPFAQVLSPHPPRLLPDRPAGHLPRPRPEPAGWTGSPTSPSTSISRSRRSEIPLIGDLGPLGEGDPDRDRRRQPVAARVRSGWTRRVGSCTSSRRRGDRRQ